MYTVSQPRCTSQQRPPSEAPAYVIVYVGSWALLYYRLWSLLSAASQSRTHLMFQPKDRLPPREAEWYQEIHFVITTPSDPLVSSGMLPGVLGCASQLLATKDQSCAILEWEEWESEADTVTVSTPRPTPTLPSPVYPASKVEIPRLQSTLNGNRFSREEAMES